MTVPDCATERGNIWEGKTHKNDLTSFNVQIICFVFMFKLKKFVVTVREVFTQTELSYSRLNIHVIGSANGLLKFCSTLI